MRKIDFSTLRSINARYTARRFVSSLTEQWYFKGDRASEDRKRLLISTYNANVVANLIGGSFWTGLLLLLNADDAFIGTLTMIAVAANMLQMFAPLLLERLPQRKRMIIILRSVIFFFNIVFIGVIPLFPVAKQAQLALTGIAVLIVNVFNAIIAPGISIWHIQSIPPDVRTSYYSLITMTTGAVVAIVNFLGGKLVDMLKLSGNEYAGLLILRLVALGLAVYDICLYAKIAEYPYEANEGGKFTVKDLIVKPFKEKLYLRSVAAAFLWNISANIPGSYYTVYLLKNVEVTYSYLMLVNLLNVVIILFLTPVWRRVLQRLDWFKTLYVAMGLYLLHYIALAFVTKGALWIYLVGAVWSYLVGIGINLSFSAIPYVNMPAKNQTVFIGFYATAANFAALIGVAIGKYFVLWTENVNVRMLGVNMGNKQLLMVVTAFMMLLSVLGIYWSQRTTPGPDAEKIVY